MAAPPVGEAARLIADVIDYYTQTMKRPPRRLPVSRQSRFFPEELTGFQDALSSYEYDLVALAPPAGPLAMDLSLKGGQPSADGGAAALTRQGARENPGWGLPADPG